MRDIICNAHYAPAYLYEMVNVPLGTWPQTKPNLSYGPDRWHEAWDYQQEHRINRYIPDETFKRIYGFNRMRHNPPPHGEKEKEAE